MRIALAALLVTSVLPCAAQTFGSRPRNAKPGYTNRLAPYVPSPQQIVDKMLEQAGLKTGETLYDLGCGDGRILISAVQKYRARAVGVELSEPLVKQTRDRIYKLNLQDFITIIHGDLLEVNLSSADVVTIYLETGANEKLRPILERDLKPGSRVVSHDFAVRGWKPTRTDKLDAFSRVHTIYLYEMPPSK